MIEKYTKQILAGKDLQFREALELAFELRELGILSIPLNILTPIKETPFAELRPLSVAEVLRCLYVQETGVCCEE